MEMNNDSIDISSLQKIMDQVIPLAAQYRRLTGKPLGITGEVGEFLVAKLLGVQLMSARWPGYDAVSPNGRRIQIKARCFPNGEKLGQRVGQIKFKHNWDSIALILMDETFAPLAI